MSFSAEHFIWQRSDSYFSLCSTKHSISIPAFSKYSFTEFILQAEAKRVGAPFYTVDDVLNKEEISYRSPLNSGEFADIDNLNTDIARAALT